MDEKIFESIFIDIYFDHKVVTCGQRWAERNFRNLRNCGSALRFHTFLKECALVRCANHKKILSCALLRCALRNKQINCALLRCALRIKQIDCALLRCAFISEERNIFWLFFNADDPVANFIAGISFCMSAN